MTTTIRDLKSQIRNTTTLDDVFSIVDSYTPVSKGLECVVKPTINRVSYNLTNTTHDILLRDGNRTVKSKFKFAHQIVESGVHFWVCVNSSSSVIIVCTNRSSDSKLLKGNCFSKS